MGHVVYPAVRVGLAVTEGFYSAGVDGLDLSRKSFLFFSGKWVVGVLRGFKGFCSISFCFSIC